MWLILEEIGYALVKTPLKCTVQYIQSVKAFDMATQNTDKVDMQLNCD